MVSGLTVMIAMAGLFLTGSDVFSGVAIGTIVVVGVAVAGSLTFLPALLSWLGRLGRPRQDPVPRPPQDGRASVPAVGRAGQARRAASRRLGRAGRGRLLALAAPALGMRLGSPPNGGFPASTPVVRTLARIQSAFPQSPSPAMVVVTGRDLSSPAMTRAIARLRSDATGTGSAPSAGHRDGDSRRPRAADPGAAGG